MPFGSGGGLSINPRQRGWVRVAEASALTAGLIGGVGLVPAAAPSAAHASNNGPQPAECLPRQVSMAPKVGLVCWSSSAGRLLSENRLAVQGARVSRYDQSPKTRNIILDVAERLISCSANSSFPVCLEDLGLSRVSLEELQQVCAFACQPGSDLHHLTLCGQPPRFCWLPWSHQEGCESGARATPESIIAQDVERKPT